MVPEVEGTRPKGDFCYSFSPYGVRQDCPDLGIGNSSEPRCRSYDCPLGKVLNGLTIKCRQCKEEQGGHNA